MTGQARPQDDDGPSDDEPEARPLFDSQVGVQGDELTAAVEEATSSALQALISAPEVDKGPRGDSLEGTLSPLKNMVSGFFGSLDPGASVAQPGSVDEVSNRIAKASSAGGTVASAVGATLRSLGLDSKDYDEQLEDARRALLQSIGVGSVPSAAYRDDWSGWPSFDMPLAIQMAEYAFDSYNNPAEGSRWVAHPDGSRTSYLSANLIRTLYSGILMIEVKGQPRMTAGEADPAGAFLSGGVPNYDGHGEAKVESSAWIRLRLQDGLQEVSLGSKNPSNRPGSNETFFMYTSRGDSSPLEIEVMENRKKSFPFSGEDEKYDRSPPHP